MPGTGAGRKIRNASLRHALARLKNSAWRVFPRRQIDAARAQTYILFDICPPHWARILAAAGAKRNKRPLKIPLTNFRMILR